MDWLALLAVTTVAGVVLDRWPRRSPPAALQARAGHRVDAILLLVLVVWGLVEAQALARSLNPGLAPVGWDAAEHLKLILYYTADFDFQPSGHRYPLVPVLAANLGRVAGRSPAEAGVLVSTWSHGLLPAVVYLLGRQLGPRWVAFGAALPVLHLPGLVTSLGFPGDYAFNLVSGTALAASTLAAIRVARPWAFALAGACLALVLSGAGRGLVFGTVALAAGLGGLAWVPRRQRLGALAALVVPSLAAWLAHAVAAPPLIPLEDSISLVDRDYAYNHGIQVDAGLVAPHQGGPGHAPPPPLHGSGWVFGSAASLWNLPRTLAFLARPSPVAPPLPERLAQARDGARQDLGLGWMGILALAPLACLAAFRGGPGRRALQAAFLAATLLVFAMAALRLPWVTRYAFQALVLVPPLVLAGAAAAAGWGRPGPRSEWSFLPVAVLAVFLSGWPTSPVGVQVARARTLAAPADPDAATDPSRGLLQATDAVVDVTPERRLSIHHFNRRDVVVGSFERGDEPPIRVPGTAHPRRYLVLWGRKPPWDAALRAELDGSPRFRKVRPDVYQDLSPGDDAVLLPGHVAMSPR